MKAPGNCLAYDQLNNTAFPEEGWGPGANCLLVSEVLPSPLYLLLPCSIKAPWDSTTIWVLLSHNARPKQFALVEIRIYYRENLKKPKYWRYSLSEKWKSLSCWMRFKSFVYSQLSWSVWGGRHFQGFLSKWGNYDYVERCLQ